MRLINVDTFKLESFFGSSTPPYAVLSHTWGEDNEELSFADIQRNDLGDPASTVNRKVSGCLVQARFDGLRYVWIDTCCIDKTNSVELNEAINSMFRWYEEAKVCYVYLAECALPFLQEGQPNSLPPSSWFRRGWTLQELLAPKELRVYDRNWQLIGDRRAIAPEMSRLTGIPVPFLAKYRPLREASVAQRMSWASNRVTKREEDTAYCLLGIFGITMTMTYGELGARAFQRLQRKILDEIDDDSILAWGMNIPQGASPTYEDAVYASALAASPSDFSGCGRIIAFAHDEYAERPVFAPGYIQLPTRVIRTEPVNPKSVYFAVLRCSTTQGQLIGIPLIWTKQRGICARPEGHPPIEVSPQHLPPNLVVETMKVKTVGGRQTSGNAEIAVRFFIDTSATNLKLVEVYPKEFWEAGDQSLVVKGAARHGPAKNHLAVMRLRPANQDGFDMIALLDFWTGFLDSPHMTGKYSVLSFAGPQHELEDFSRCYRYLRPTCISRRAVFPVDGGYVPMDVQNVEDEAVMVFLVRFLAPEAKRKRSVVIDARDELQIAYRTMAKELERVALENARLSEKVSALQRELLGKKKELALGVTKLGPGGEAEIQLPAAPGSSFGGSPFSPPAAPGAKFGGSPYRRFEY